MKENIHLEYKSAVKGVPKSLYETVCAFLNHDGGTIYLGVDDNGQALGLPMESIDLMIQSIATTLNNQTVFEPPFLLYPQEIILDGKPILRLQVPQSSRVHRFNGVVYDRSSDGDFKIKNPELIARMVAKKTAYYSELRVYPFIKIKDLDKDTIQTALGYLSNKKPDHPWVKLKGFAFLKQAGLTQFDPETGKEAITLAGILLFGTELTIQSVLPQFKIDVLIKKEQVDRYDDRLDLRVNLIESYLKIMPFVGQYLPDPFYLEDTTRVSLRDRIFRELVANLIVHREYTSHLPARILVFKNSIEFTNPCIPHNHGKLIAGRFSPYQKNPLISKFFLQLGWVEEIGSGFANVHKWLPLYQKQAKIEFLEDEVFTTRVAFAIDEKKNKNVQNKAKLGVESIVKGVESEMAVKVLEILKLKPLRKAEIARYLGKEKPTRYLNDLMVRLLQSNLVEYIYPENPNSRLQKYLLTDMGVELLQNEIHSESGVEMGVESGVELGVESNVKGVESEMALEVLEILKLKPLSKAEIARHLGKEKPTRYLNDLMVKLLNKNLVVYTNPEKPNSRLQKYKIKPK